MPLTPAVLELADQLLLLCVDTGRGLPGCDRRADGVIDVSELGVTIRVLLAQQRLTRRLQTEPKLAFQQPSSEVLPADDPCAPSSWARFRTLLEVHNSTRSGSPRTSSPTSTRNASSSPESEPSPAGRPPRRTRSGGPTTPARRVRTDPRWCDAHVALGQADAAAVLDRRDKPSAQPVVPRLARSSAVPSRTRRGHAVRHIHGETRPPAGRLFESGPRR